MKIGIKVLNAMTKNPITITKDALVTSCARKMLSNNVGALIIKNGDKLEGIVTEKDIVEDAVAKELNIKRTKVKDIMTKGMITISPDADLSEAVDLMNRENFRRLPVIKDGKLVGLLTARDVLYAQPVLYNKLYNIFVSKKIRK